MRLGYHIFHVQEYCYEKLFAVFILVDRMVLTFKTIGAFLSQMGWLHYTKLVYSFFLKRLKIKIINSISNFFIGRRHFSTKKILVCFFGYIYVIFIILFMYII